MLRNLAIASIAVAALVFAANLQAQGPGGGRGPGMGMGMGGGMLGLLQIEKVQKEIELDADQKEKLQAVTKELQDSRTANRESMRDLSREDPEKSRRHPASEAIGTHQTDPTASSRRDGPIQPRSR
jgi:Spy/CpxP family protein refolding chaperone